MNVDEKQKLLLNLLRASLTSYQVFAVVINELKDHLVTLQVNKVRETLSSAIEEGESNTLPIDDVDAILRIYTRNSLDLIEPIITYVGMDEGEELVESLIKYSGHLHHSIMRAKLELKYKTVPLVGTKENILKRPVKTSTVVDMTKIK